MKHSSTLVIIGGIVGLVTADGWWWGDARPECAVCISSRTEGKSY